MIYEESRRLEKGCLMFAAFIHCFLWFWKASPYKGPVGDPISEVNFEVEQEEAAKPEPPEVKESPSAMNFVKKILNIGIATPKTPIKLPDLKPPEELSTGGGPAGKIETTNRFTQLAKMTAEPSLANKARVGGPAGFAVTGLAPTRNQGLAGELAPGAPGGGGTLKNRDSGNVVAKGILPFNITRAPQNSLSTGEDDAPRIATGKLSDKGVLKTNAGFVGTGGGIGGGDGSGAGNAGGSGTGGGGSLTDRGKGLAGMPTFTGTAGNPSAGGEEGGTRLSGADDVGGTGVGPGRGSGRGRDVFTIEGDLSGRPILYKVIPSIPEKLREKGFSGLVSIDFSVLHSGGVLRETVSIRRSSGELSMDKAAMAAIEQWKFAALDPKAYGKIQSGTITFKIRVN